VDVARVRRLNVHVESDPVVDGDAGRVASDFEVDEGDGDDAP
jgi:hypothetical protein